MNPRLPAPTLKQNVLTIIDAAKGSFIGSKEIATKTGRKMSEISSILSTLTENQHILERKKFPHPKFKRLVFGYRRSSPQKKGGAAKAEKLATGATASIPAAPPKKTRTAAKSAPTIKAIPAKSNTAPRRATASIKPAVVKHNGKKHHSTTKTAAAVGVNIHIQIGEYLFDLTTDEAEQLYQTLDQLFHCHQ